MEWQITIGITSIVMVFATGLHLGALLYRKLSNETGYDIFWIAYPTLMINLIGVLVIMCVLIANIY